MKLASVDIVRMVTDMPFLEVDKGKRLAFTASYIKDHHSNSTGVKLSYEQCETDTEGALSGVDIPERHSNN